MSETLVSAGHDIVGAARDLSSAVRMATATASHVALVDFHLGRGGSRLEDARLLQYWGIACVYVSSNPNGCRTALDSGALGCLRKPFGAAALLGTIEAIEEILAGNIPEKLPPGFELYRADYTGQPRSFR